MDVNANVFSLSGALKVEKLTNTCEKTSRGWYSRVTTETIKNFQILMKKFFVAGTIPATNVFFSQALDVA